MLCWGLVGNFVEVFIIVEVVICWGVCYCISDNVMLEVIEEVEEFFIIIEEVKMCWVVCNFLSVLLVRVIEGVINW